MNESKNVIEAVLNSYLKTNSTRKTAKETSVSRANVTRILKENKYTLNSFCKKLEIDELAFDVLNEECAYWLGFIYADGYVDEKNSKLIIALAIKDKEHLVKFTKFLKTSKTVKNIKNDTTCVISISNKKIVSKLVEYGLYSNKSSTIEFPKKWLTPDLQQHFIRGYFDGDGSVYRQGKSAIGIGIIGTVNFIKDMAACLPVNGKIRTIASPNMGRFEIYNTKGSIDFCNYLYENSTIVLDRKYLKFQSLQEKTSTTKLTGPKQVTL